MHVVTAYDPVVHEVSRRDGPAKLRNYIGAAANMKEGPQAFLADLYTPGSTVKPHFHDVDQYQVIVGAGAKLGRHDIRSAVTFHYADAFTTYGPIIGDDNGVVFFTLRAAAASGHFGMPGSREHQLAPRGRNIVVEVPEVDGELPVGNVETTELIEEHDDGLNAVRVRCAPGADAQCGAAPGSAAFILVLAGAVHIAGEELAVNSLVHVDASELPVRVTAGAEGADLLVMRLPRPSERVGSDPHSRELTGSYRSSSGFKPPAV